MPNALIRCASHPPLHIALLLGVAVVVAGCDQWPAFCNVAAIERGLASPEADNRLHAAVCASKLGAEANSTVPSLIRILGDYRRVGSQSTVNKAVEVALKRVGANARAVAPLVRRLAENAQAISTGLMTEDDAYNVFIVTGELLERTYVPTGFGPAIAHELAPRVNEITNPKVWADRCIAERILALSRGEVFDISNIPWNGPLCVYPPGTEPQRPTLR